MSTRAKVTVDTDSLRPFSDKRDLYIRTVHVVGDEGMQTFVVRPWGGSVEIRTNGSSVVIDAFAVPALLRALRQALPEALS